MTAQRKHGRLRGVANAYYSPDRQRAEKVNDLFADIAPRYDFINDLQSFGLHRWWKRRLLRLAAVRSGESALDLCCGTGDVAGMLESGNLGGKCADLNALFVGLARAQGMPARDIYGLRVAPSKFGYRSLGAGSADVTKAQHCRAEFYSASHGWVPVDPADVRKVILEEKPDAQLPIDDPLVKAARVKLFGAWEMNWLAFNTAHDVALPKAKSGKVAFLMYPQCETEAGLLDTLDPGAATSTNSPRFA